jgi:transketolase
VTDERPDDGRKPVPDPTVLTTQALLREIAALKELMEARLAGLDRLFEEKFDTLETSRLEQKKDTQSAIDAALTAQKNAVAKSEAAVGKQLEDQQKASNIAISDLRRSIDDLKERIGDVAQIVNGSVQQRVGAREDRTGLYASIGIVVTVLLAAIVVVGLIVGTRST